MECLAENTKPLTLNRSLFLLYVTRRLHKPLAFNWRQCPSPAKGGIANLLQFPLVNSYITFYRIFFCDILHSVQLSREITGRQIHGLDLDDLVVYSGCLWRYNQKTCKLSTFLAPLATSRGTKRLAHLSLSRAVLFLSSALRLTPTWISFLPMNEVLLKRSRSKRSSPDSSPMFVSSRGQQST